ncbi:hypothetical protein T10_5391 [Trichinella papuae]|uniref:Uncharacterized protein n=1 Tax=Trichinella papuae TaxID=268474 RepID=A0A0V1LY20_9BILA|nr:hypothetical protein T10_5391 [Trichinella papuae]
MLHNLQVVRLLFTNHFTSSGKRRKDIGLVNAL